MIGVLNEPYYFMTINDLSPMSSLHVCICPSVKGARPLFQVYRFHQFTVSVLRLLGEQKRCRR